MPRARRVACGQPSRFAVGHGILLSIGLLIVEFGVVVLAGQAQCVVKVFASRVSPVHGIGENVGQAAEDVARSSGVIRQRIFRHAAG